MEENTKPELLIDLGAMLCWKSFKEGPQDSFVTAIMGLPNDHDIKQSLGELVWIFCRKSKLFGGKKSGSKAAIKWMLSARLFPKEETSRGKQMTRMTDNYKWEAKLLVLRQ